MTANPRPYVFQTQHNPRIDTRDALRYGELRMLFENAGEPAVAPARMLQEVRRLLSGYTEHDYLLPVGSPALIGTATTVAARQSGGVVNFLLWDKRARCYMTSTIDFNKS